MPANPVALRIYALRRSGFNRATIAAMTELTEQQVHEQLLDPTGPAPSPPGGGGGGGGGSVSYVISALDEHPLAQASGDTEDDLPVVDTTAVTLAAPALIVAGVAGSVRIQAGSGGYFPQAKMALLRDDGLDMLAGIGGAMPPGLPGFWPPDGGYMEWGNEFGPGYPSSPTAVAPGDYTFELRMGSWASDSKSYLAKNVAAFLVVLSGG